MGYQLQPFHIRCLAGQPFGRSHAEQALVTLADDGEQRS
jgi:hypothetical protein